MEDLIIIIPTHNRQHYLRRVIKYYSEFPCKVYICDSSKEKADVESSGNIIYRWVPQSNFYGKVLDVLNETSADFYALSPDDDFIKKSSLEVCLQVLETDDQYVTGIGKQILFNDNFDGSFIYDERLNKMVNIMKEEDLNGDLYVKYVAKNYQNILWSLFKRSVIKNSFQVLRNCNFSNGNFVEIVLGIETLKAGKFYYIEKGFNYREFTQREHWGKSENSITDDNIQKNDNLRSDIEIFNEVYKGDQIASLWFFTYLDCQNTGEKKLFVRVKNHLIKIVRTIIKRGERIEYNFIRYNDSEMAKLVRDALES